MYYTVDHDQETHYDSKTDEKSVSHFLKAKFDFRKETSLDSTENRKTIRENRKIIQNRIKELSSTKHSLDAYLFDPKFSAQAFTDGKLKTTITVHDTPTNDGSLFQRAIDWNNILDLDAVEIYLLTGQQPLYIPK